MMKRFLAGGLLAAAALSACGPDIEMDGAPAPMATVEFDPGAVPAVVPTPNDLAMKDGLVNAPIDPNSSPAQQEFTRDYLNTLNGFPVSAVATAKVTGGVTPTSVSAQSVRVFSLNERNVDGVRIAWNADQGAITVAPPATGWTKGGHYAVAILTGEGGLKGQNGQPVEASSTWAFVRSRTSLVTCDDLKASDCRPTTELIPSTETDLAKKLADQTKKAIALETLRRLYKGPLDLLEAQGVPRERVALLWTWRTMNQAEMTFDPAASVIPFPSDLLRDPTTGKVKLPLPAETDPRYPLLAGLNMLDGFSTTAMIVSENSDALGATDRGQLPDTLPADQVLLVNGATGKPADVTACVGCGSSLTESNTKQTGPQQLQLIPNTPLAEKTPYVAVVKTTLQTLDGFKVAPNATFALARLQNSLLDADKKSTVSVVSDAQARALEPLRLAFKKMFDGLKAAGIARKDVALAWPVTTQSTVSVLKTLHDAQFVAPLDAVSAAPDYVVDVTARVPAMPGVAKVFEGQFHTPFPLTMTGSQKVRFLLAIPTSTTVPAGGYPVAVFGHGLTGNRTHMLRLASAMAATGRATLATDVTLHGERTSCVGAAAALKAKYPTATDDYACANPATQKCDTDAASASYGRCIARDRTAAAPCDASSGTADLACAASGLGRCLPDNKCEAGDFLRNTDGSVALSGHNILDTTNLFATRDNFRQQVVDLASLEHLIQGDAFATALTAANGGTAIALATDTYDYVGQSLGGILGTLHTAASPFVARSVLNVPGGDPAGILLESVSFSAQRAGFIDTLKKQGINPGTPAYDNFLVIARWILDPADPRNAAAAMLNGTGVPQGRAVLLQSITEDQTVPNSTTDRLEAAAKAGQVKPAIVRFDPPVDPEPATGQAYTPSTEGLKKSSRHGFLLNFDNPSITNAAQGQAATFLDTGTQP